LPPKDRLTEGRKSRIFKKHSVQFRVNGFDYDLLVEPKRTLLEVLREDFGLTGTKLGCGEGTCGACTVVVNDKAVYSCMTLAVDCQGKDILTIEGIGKPGAPYPLQEAFIRHDALQCGYCTPAQIMTLYALLKKNPKPTLDEIRRAVSGNLCRCGTYSKIFLATMDVACRR
jgi:aerobic-type carbon monoxide dehydrogenase small subunit (CoxS/CutS family)